MCVCALARIFFLPMALEKSQYGRTAYNILLPAAPHSENIGNCWESNTSSCSDIPSTVGYENFITALNWCSTSIIRLSHQYFQWPETMLKLCIWSVYWLVSWDLLYQPHGFRKVKKTQEWCSRPSISSSYSSRHRYIKEGNSPGVQNVLGSDHLLKFGRGEVKE